MKFRPKNRKLLLLSLKVLSQIADGINPSRRDLIILRHNAELDQSDVSIQEICLQTIRRQLTPAAELQKIQQLASSIADLGRTYHQNTNDSRRL